MSYSVTPWTAACQASLSITNSHAYSNSCPLSWWCHPTIYPLSSPSPPAFNLSQYQGLFWWVPSSHQVAKVLGASASASVPPINIQDWFPLEWTGWISLQSKGLSSLLQHHSSKASILWCSAFFMVHLSHPYKTTGKTTALTRRVFVSQVMSLLFNMLSRFVIAKDIHN